VSTIGGEQAVPAFASDLNLDQVVSAVAGDREERGLIAQLLLHRAADIETVEYRHEVFRDLDDGPVFEAARRFTERLHQVHAHLRQLAKMDSGRQREGWFLDAAAIYCDAVSSLANDLALSHVSSRGLSSFRDYLTTYADSAEFVNPAHLVRSRSLGDRAASAAQLDVGVALSLAGRGPTEAAEEACLDEVVPVSAHPPRSHTAPSAQPRFDRRTDRPGEPVSQRGGLGVSSSYAAIGESDAQVAAMRPLTAGSATATFAARLATLPTTRAHSRNPLRPPLRESASSTVDAAPIAPPAYWPRRKPPAASRHR
jgi:hypothetical protein